MKNRFQKLLSTALMLIMVIVAALGVVGCNSSDKNLVTVKPAMAQGTIDANAGEVKLGVPTRLYTQNFLLLDDYSKVSVESGYKAYYHFYDVDKKWINTSNRWIEGEVKVEKLSALSKSAVYFAVIIGRNDDGDLFLEDYTEGTLTLTLAEGLKAPTESKDAIAPEDAGESDFLELIPSGTTEPAMLQGTVDGSTGEVVGNVTTRLTSKELIPVENYDKVKIGKGYKAWFHCYDKDGKWVNGFGWKEAKDGDLEVAVSEVKSHAMSALYFRLVVGKLDETNVTPDNFPADALKLIVKTEKVSDFTFENVFEIGAAVHGPWQEGAIFDGKLFLLNHDERGAVYSLEGKKRLGDFTFDRKDFFSPHANSMCFGSQYYDKNDKYPLLYLSVYNNYEGKPNQYEGHCGVYRVLEDGSGFKAELVQVIRIGFTEDLKMWKSMPNNGDVCPYGNFIVDTDNDDLYAFVMRDADKTTRFFKFKTPSVNDGKHDSTFGCKLVTLEKGDIKDQFDTEYSVYLQGADYLNGNIISLEGLGFGRDGGATLKMIDLKTKKVAKVYDPVSAGVYNEPEVLAVDPETKKVYYGSSDGQLRWLTCIDKYMAGK